MVLPGTEWGAVKDYERLCCSGFKFVFLHTPFLCKSGLLPYKREIWGVLKVNMFWSLVQSSSWRVNRENSCSVKPLAVCEENIIAHIVTWRCLDQARIQNGLPQLDDMKYMGTQSLWLSPDANHQNFSGFTIKVTWFQWIFFHLCSQYSLDVNIWWITVKNPCRSSSNKRWEDTNTGRIHLSI